MNRGALLTAILVLLAACAAEQRDAADLAPAPEASWWAWVVPGQVIGAAAPERAPGGADAWLHVLTEAAGGAPLAILNLREKAYPELAHEVAAALHLPIQDFSPPSAAQADEALAFIDGQVAQGRVVVVHCHGGCGRTGTILAAWLMTREDLSAEDALTAVRARRACFVETVAQEAFLGTYTATPEETP